MEVDPVEKSPASSSSSYDFLLELLGPLKQMAFECFLSNTDPVEFIGKFNRLLDEGLIPSSQSPENVIQVLIEVGCSKNDCHPLLLPYLDTLWECKYFTYKQYVKALISYRNLDKPQCIQSFVIKVGLLLKRIDCDFRSDDSVNEMCDVFVLALRWYCRLLSDIFTARREHGIQLAKLIAGHVQVFENDHFARYVAFCVSFVDQGIFPQLHEEMITTCEQMQEMSKNVYIPKDIKEMVELLPSLLESLPSKPDFPVDYVETYRFGTTQPRPAILSLVTVYSVFRVLSTNDEISNALMNIGNTFLMSKIQILTDLFRGIFFILLDYHEAEGSTADQHSHLHTLILSEVFVYKRLGQIVEVLLETGQCTTDQLIEALNKVAKNSVLMNALDRRQLDNTLANILDGSRLSHFLSSECCARIMELRMEGMKKDADLFCLLYGDNIQQREQSRHWQFKKADEMARRIREHPEDIERLIIELIDFSDLIHLDLVLACLCVDGKIKTFSSKLSELTTKYEHGSEDNPVRNEVFDSAFFLLMRVRQLFPDLRLEEITDGDTTSTFYKWTERLYDHLEQGNSLPVNEEIKQSTFIAQFGRLKLGHPFWQNGWDFAQLLDHVPAIGEAMLDEITSSPHHKVDEEALKNILKTFGEISCMFMCLCQWLETNSHSDSLQTLSRVLKDVGTNHVKQFDDVAEGEDNLRLKHQINRWNLIIQLVSPNLERLARGPRSTDIIYPYLINCARRQIRPLDPMEIPTMQVLKDAFFYATQQGWASPSVIVCIDRLTKNVKQVEWIQCWIQQMFKKQTNADELEIAGEMCLAVAMTKPVICLLCIIQKIIDENEFTNSTISFNHTWILARMLVRAMLIVCWSADTWQDKRKRFKRWQASRKRKAEDDKDQKPEETVEDDTVMKTLMTVFLVFQKEIKPSLIRLRITFICFFMLELAMAPNSEYRQRLVDMIPEGVIFSLCRLEPTFFNLPILLKIYNMDNPQHRQICLQMFCMLRKKDSYKLT